MANDFFRFKQFVINQGRCSFKVGTDGVILGAYADISHANSILDIGAGTGLISLMLAQRSAALITAIEPDKESFSQLVENVNSCQWSSRIEAINTDLQNFTSKQKFDLIISNPPYFQNSIRNPDNRKSAARHNDSLSNEDLLAGVFSFLADDGLFQVIIPFTEGAILIADAAAKNLYCNSVVKIKPTPSSPIKRLVLTLGKRKEQMKERFLTIEQGRRHDFTDDYVNLTKDFYLKF